MRVLVIDDEPRNIASALLLKKRGHEVKTCETVEEAFALLRGGMPDFDAVCVDLYMPIGAFRGAMSSRAHRDEMWKSVNRETSIPAGLIFAVRCANDGIPVVLCTDSDHHRDYLCSLLDLLSLSNRETRRIAYVEARCVAMRAIWDAEKSEIVEERDWDKRKGHPLIKDWHEAMMHSGLFPDLVDDEDN